MFHPRDQVASEKELEDELARLKLELAEWKAKYEHALQQRKHLEQQLHAVGSAPIDSTTSPPSATTLSQADKPTTTPTPTTTTTPTPTTTTPTPTTPTPTTTTAPIAEEPAAVPRRAPLRPPPPGSAGGMRVPVLDRSKKELTAVDKDDVLAKTWLKKLYLFQNKISEIPSEIGALTELQILDMKYNLLSTIPDALLKCTNLTELLLAGNTVSNMPRDWQGLRALTRLDLSHNKLKEFPTSLLTATTLVDLNLERNKFVELPKGIEVLTNLTKLDLKDNEIKELPPQIGSLVSLSELLLSDNQLKTLPNEVGHLVHLTNLQLPNNLVASLPSDICHLTALSKLNLKNNRLSHLPESVSVDDVKGWYSLTSLNLARNQFDHIPPELWTIEALSELNLTSNKIKEVPADISRLYNLHSLLLGDNQLVAVPEEIVYIEALEVLHLFFNQLSSFPENLNSLFNLRVLFLGYNRLAAVPDLSPLTALEELLLSSNPLGEGLHPSVWDLNTLRQLYLHNTNLNIVPEEISNLTNMSILDLSGNSIAEIPSNITACECLSRINLAHNKLSAIPEDIDDLRELIHLDLSHNQFKQLPGVVQYIKERVEILANDNPLEPGIVEGLDVHYWVPSKRFNYDAAEMLGRRPTMEDAFSFRGALDGNKDRDFFAVYDGHAGRVAATFAGEHFHPILSKKLVAGGDPLKHLAACFPEVNDQFKSFINSADATLKHAGCTGACVLIDKNTLYLGNVGDTRVVLNRGGCAMRLSIDHKPGAEDEEARIRALGGYVTGETYRVNGLLAVSRAIGDFYMHPFVTVDPYLNQIELTDEDEYLIIACDGVWDEVQDQEAVDVLKHVAASKDPFLTSATLRDYAYLQGSDDNISAVVIFLKPRKL
eukprot:TRINITY_DN2387_c0_g1_i3.p1 TRINITY_DN2387_c0_g1~~TRINITY_DN2387_c0_g1_i3.p1  ORF type:complete len:884 (+),score=128.56 TRINITY_DN2387_c0_g1_i3:162-2813(+)